MEKSTTYRNIAYRLIPGTRRKAVFLSRCAGACRYVWNRSLALNLYRYNLYRHGFLMEKPPVSFFSMGKQFTRLRRRTPWLQELPFAAVRFTLKRQAATSGGEIVALPSKPATEVWLAMTQFIHESSGDADHHRGNISTTISYII